MEISQPIRAAGGPEDRILSLDDGAFYFAENRKTSKVASKTSLKDVIDSYDLPKDIADRLRGVNVK